MLYNLLFVLALSLIGVVLVLCLAVLLLPLLPCLLLGERKHARRPPPP